MLGDLIACHVGGHDEDGILAVNGFPLPIRQSALQQHRGNTSGVSHRTWPKDEAKGHGSRLSPQRLIFEGMPKGGGRKEAGLSCRGWRSPHLSEGRQALALPRARPTRDTLEGSPGRCLAGEVGWGSPYGCPYVPAILCLPPRRGFGSDTRALVNPTGGGEVVVTSCLRPTPLREAVAPEVGSKDSQRQPRLLAQPCPWLRFGLGCRAWRWSGRDVRRSRVRALRGGSVGSCRRRCLDQLQQRCPDAPQSLPEESVHSSPWHRGPPGGQGGLRGALWCSEGTTGKHRLLVA